MCEFSFERSKFIQKPVGHQNPFKITDLDMYSSKNRRDDFSRIYADTPNKLLAYPKLGLVSRNQFSSRKDHKDQVKNTMHDRFDIIMGNQKEKSRPWNQSDWDHFHEWFQLRAQSRKRQIIEPEVGFGDQLIVLFSENRIL